MKIERIAMKIEWIERIVIQIERIVIQIKWDLTILIERILQSTVLPIENYRRNGFLKEFKIVSQLLVFL